MTKPRTLLRKLLRIPNRNELIFQRINPRGHGLEIGPSHQPIAPKSAGYDVKILDYTDREGLIRKYTELGVDPSRIEDVDFVWRGESYTELVGGEGIFDWVIASHCMEHVPDMVGFLADCRKILKPGGVLVLALPDHRYIFDALRMPSSLAAVIDSHLRRDRNPTPGTVAEFNLLFSNRGGKEIWSRWSLDRFRRPTLVRSPDEARKAMARRIESEEYVDVHVWCFTPDSFHAILGGLRDLGILDGWQWSAPLARGYEFLSFLTAIDPASPAPTAR